MPDVPNLNASIRPTIRVAIAGASGFVGRPLAASLGDRAKLIALSRRAPDKPAGSGVEWRSADLFSLLDAERALEGADVAVYLVHSMMPHAALTQGSFEDLDLICADNFARAAKKAKVSHIVYLGGLMPPEGDAPSKHLASRYEVERTLAAHGVPLTALRAGLVLGQGGSSFEMMRRLVERLPVMVCPNWARSLTQPIALAYVVQLLEFAIFRPELSGKAYDVGGPQVLSYVDLLRATARALGKERSIVTMPFRVPNLSLLWISLITGSPKELVLPLVESLKHNMVVRDGGVFVQKASLAPCPLDEALQASIQTEAPEGERRERAQKSLDRRVCSVQRLENVGALSPLTIAQEYMRFLPRFCRPLLRVETSPELCRFFLRPMVRPLLELTFAPNRSDPDRQLFYLTGGLLLGKWTGPRPRLEFRRVLNGQHALAAIHDYAPQLPWALYRSTQALVHLLVMRSFLRHLHKLNGVDRGTLPDTPRGGAY